MGVPVLIIAIHYSNMQNMQNFKLKSVQKYKLKSTNGTCNILKCIHYSNVYGKCNVPIVQTSRKI